MFKSLNFFLFFLALFEGTDRTVHRAYSLLLRNQCGHGSGIGWMQCRRPMHCTVTSCIIFIMCIILLIILHIQTPFFIKLYIPNVCRQLWYWTHGPSTMTKKWIQTMMTLSNASEIKYANWSSLIINARCLKQNTRNIFKSTHFPHE